MARVSGPLMSVAATGSFADTMTYRRLPTRGGMTPVNMRRAKTENFPGLLFSNERLVRNNFLLMRSTALLFSPQSPFLFRAEEEGAEIQFSVLLERVYGKNYFSAFWKSLPRGAIYNALIRAYDFEQRNTEALRISIDRWNTFPYRVQPARFNRNYAIDVFRQKIGISGVSAAIAIATAVEEILKIGYADLYFPDPNLQGIFFPFIGSPEERPTAIR